MQDKKILYTTLDNMGVYYQKNNKKYESDYIKNYLEVLVQLENKDKWKYSGSSAAFQGYTPENRSVNAGINGIAGSDHENFFYTAFTSEVSGIFKKEYLSGEENYVILSNDKIFYSIEYNKQKKQILTSLSNESVSKDIAIFYLSNNDLNIITSGDSLDENATFSRFNDEIFFNSRGIARNKDMEIVGISNSVIFSFNQFTYDIKETIVEDGYDLLTPKTDKKGNIYYIRKPYKNKNTSSNIFIDIILMPFRLVLGLGRLLMFLSKLSAKKDQKNEGITMGNNPAKFKEKSEKELFVFEEKIDANKEESKNLKKGIKNAGYAPYSYELWKMDVSGEKTKIKNSVLSYDVDDEGNLIYTNGKYVFALTSEGGEEVLFKDKLITSVSMVD